MSYLKEKTIKDLSDWHRSFDKMFKEVLIEPLYATVTNYTNILKSSIEDLYDNILDENGQAVVKLAKKIRRLVKNNPGFKDFQDLLKFGLMNYGKNYWVYYTQEKSFRNFKKVLEILIK